MHTNIQETTYSRKQLMTVFGSGLALGLAFGAIAFKPSVKQLEAKVAAAIAANQQAQMEETKRQNEQFFKWG